MCCHPVTFHSARLDRAAAFLGRPLEWQEPAGAPARPARLSPGDARGTHGSWAPGPGAAPPSEGSFVRSRLSLVWEVSRARSSVWGALPSRPASPGPPTSRRRGRVGWGRRALHGGRPLLAPRERRGARGRVASPSLRAKGEEPPPFPKMTFRFTPEPIRTGADLCAGLGPPQGCRDGGRPPPPPLSLCVVVVSASCPTWARTPQGAPDLPRPAPGPGGLACCLPFLEPLGGARPTRALLTSQGQRSPPSRPTGMEGGGLVLGQPCPRMESWRDVWAQPGLGGWGGLGPELSGAQTPGGLFGSGPLSASILSWMPLGVRSG